MAIPDTPQTRGEQYLNAIATGDTSGIPDTPQTREEMYLDAIAKGGGGSAEGAALVVKNVVNDGVETLDKTWQEIFDSNYCLVVTLLEEDNKMIDYFITLGFNTETQKYYAETGSGIEYTCDAPTDYPSYAG